MKKITVKRLIYHDENGAEHIGGVEYSSALSNMEILGAIHEVGKTQWIGRQLWVMRYGRPLYHITVETFTQYQKRWYELVLDAVRRI